MGKTPTRSSNSPRRREVRRTVQKTSPQLPWRQRVREPRYLAAAGYVLLITVLCSFFALQSTTQYRPGQLISKPLVSRVQFQAEDESQTRELKEAAYDNQPRIFQPNEAYLKTLTNRFNALIATAQAPYLSEVPESTRKQMHLSPAAFADLKQFVRDGSPTEDWEYLVRLFLAQMYAVPVLSAEDYSMETGQQALNKILILNPFAPPGASREQPRYPVNMINVTDSEKFNRHLADAVQVFPPALQDPVMQLMQAKPEPTYLPDPDLTQQRRQQAAAAVQPHFESYRANEVLVPAGDRLTTRKIEVLDAERKAYQSSLSYGEDMLRMLGMVGSVLMVAVGIWLYLWAYKPRVIENSMRGLALALLVVTAQGAAVFLTALNPTYLFLTATVPTLVVATILVITYDQRFALAIAVAHGGLVMLSMNLAPSFGLVLAVGVGMFVWQLDAIRTRSKLVVSGLWAGLAMAAATVIVALASRPLYLESQYFHIGRDALMSLTSGVLVGTLVQAVLPALERLFKVTTDMTLRELNDASHPLLQRLAQEAPGTYQHSLRIADMAEAAADAIGGNGLLCRVGAMYHDIGKTNKPLYFIENQGGGPNKHSKLSPAMSLLIIVGHVKDGVEMAREYGLPAIIRHFIESHHGTTLVEYFYHAARKQREAESQPEPSEFQFRYPGPKPQSREAAILLLCDSLEAAARALPEPTPVRLEQLVENIATKRLMDGQFDECELTLSDLHRIEQSITKTLCAIYHARIKYPGDKTESTEAATQTDETNEDNAAEPPEQKPAAAS